MNTCAAMSALRRARLGALVGCAWAATSRAAGGHFAVDDAAILDVGQCQIETWLEREGDVRTLLHVGPACRIGPMELSVNGDRQQWRDRSPTTAAGPQVKWAVAVDDRVSVGVVALIGWQGQSPRYAGAALYVPLSVHVSESLWLHANGGRDWSHGSPPTSRAGLAFVWQLAPRWALIGERFRQSAFNASRLGMRWQQSAAFSIDLSRAETIGAASGRWWTLGANWSFGARALASRPP